MAALARRQERELRAWLSGRPAPGQAARLAPALEAAAAEIEENHGVPVEVVVVGDRELDPAVEARGGRRARGDDQRRQVRRRLDRRRVRRGTPDARCRCSCATAGPGFDPAAVPADRRGVRESIVGRMERHGGRARITSAAGGGTEVELVLEGDR